MSIDTCYEYRPQVHPPVRGNSRGSSTISIGSDPDTCLDRDVSGRCSGQRMSPSAAADADAGEPVRCLHCSRVPVNERRSGCEERMDLSSLDPGALRFSRKYCRDALQSGRICRIGCGESLIHRLHSHCVPLPHRLIGIRLLTFATPPVDAK